MLFRCHCITVLGRTVNPFDLNAWLLSMLLATVRRHHMYLNPRLSDFFVDLTALRNFFSSEYFLAVDCSRIE